MSGMSRRRFYFIRPGRSCGLDRISHPKNTAAEKKSQERKNEQ
jgi:hypothetical protein